MPGNLGIVKAREGLFNNLRSGLDANGSNADLVISSSNSIVLNPGTELRVTSDLIVSGVTSLAQDPSNAFLGTRLVESRDGQDLILRPGSRGRVMVDGDLMVTGDMFNINVGSNSLANTLLLDSNAVTLGTDINPDLDSIDQGGLLMRSATYNSDPKLISLLWNKNESDAPFWHARGGDFRLSRQINDVDVAYTLAIQDDMTLVIMRQIGTTEPVPCMTFGPMSDQGSPIL